ncbi:hypothetical protein [Tahibacter soli]|jgi:hypothetical protein|uniref:Uncharacterized protein n=1 Tax=Tahibacter soli TaxID=2983605 RepID=A0A9X3YP32_9GAMM|nr:hypothetical protein [Tahibacter soli]MDC8014855.1 hypothetical protein [Tahibacter soli]
MESKKEVIEVVDENGERHIVEKAMLVPASRGRPGRPRRMELFRLVTGELVNCVGPRDFIATCSGMRLYRTS